MTIHRFLFTFATLAATSVAWAQVEGLPEPSAPRTMEFAKPKETTLGNGLRVVSIERPGLPLFSAGLLIRTGAEADPAKLSGLAQFTGGLLMRGTDRRSATQIAEDLEGLGASLKVEAGWDQTLALLTSLSSEAGPSLQILAEVIRKPAFASAEIERLRKEAIDELTVTLEQPGQLARVAAARAVLGSQPYAHSISGTPPSLRRVKRTDLVKFHTESYCPSQTVLIVAGSLPSEKVFALANEHFGNWKPTTKKESDAKKTKAEAPQPSSILIDMPDAGQAAVYVGRSTPPRRDQDYHIGQVANGILGGGFSARLNREIRIKRGLSYGCGSRLSAYRRAGMFGVATQTKNESAAEVVKVIRAELSRLGEEAVPDAEFEARQAVITGGFQRELETNEGYVKRMADFIVHDQPIDSFSSELEKIGNVKPAEVQDFAKREFNPDAMTVVVVGQGSGCKEPLGKVLPKLRTIPQSKLNLDSPTLTTAK